MSCRSAVSCVTFPCLLSGGMSPCCCWIFLSAYATADHDPPSFSSGLDTDLPDSELRWGSFESLHFLGCQGWDSLSFSSAYLRPQPVSSCPFSPPVICTRALHVICSICKFFSLCSILECIYHSLHFSENRTLKGALCRYLLYH